MWAYTSPKEANVDDHLEHLNGYVRSAAMKTFGAPTSEPRKPWVSAATWSIIRMVAPTRRELHKVLRQNPPVISRGAFMCWVAAASGCGRLASCNTFKWIAVGNAADSETEARRLTQLTAKWFRWIKTLQKLAAPSLEADRKDFLDDAAFRLECAMEDNDPELRTG